MSEQNELKQSMRRSVSCKCYFHYHCISLNNSFPLCNHPLVLINILLGTTFRNNLNWSESESEIAESFEISPLCGAHNKSNHFWLSFATIWLLLCVLDVDDLKQKEQKQNCMTWKQCFLLCIRYTKQIWCFMFRPQIHCWYYSINIFLVFFLFFHVKIAKKISMLETELEETEERAESAEE